MLRAAKLVDALAALTHRRRRASRRAQSTRSASPRLRWSRRSDRASVTSRLRSATRCRRVRGVLSPAGAWCLIRAAAARDAAAMRADARRRAELEKLQKHSEALQQRKGKLTARTLVREGTALRCAASSTPAHRRLSRRVSAGGAAADGCDGARHRSAGSRHQDAARQDAAEEAGDRGSAVRSRARNLRRMATAHLRDCTVTHAAPHAQAAPPR